MSSTTKGKKDRDSASAVHIVHGADGSQYAGIIRDTARRVGAFHKFSGTGVRFSFVPEKTT
jgi:predicted GIY-YIG superfamily endonuclease